MTTDADTIGDRVAAGREARSRGAWADAREFFETALRAEESGEAWEGLGWAGYWLHDAELTIGSRQRAYQAYRGEHDVLRADDGESAATGTAMRPDTLRAYAHDAGFSRVEVLEIPNDFWRFYRLDPMTDSPLSRLASSQGA